MTHTSIVSSDTDHAAWIQAIAQHRDRSAFVHLFTWFAPRLKAWLLRSGIGPSAAEELTQETILAVWQKAHLFNPAKAGASTWIFTIARNLRVDRQRRERHPSSLMIDPSVEGEAPEQADAALTTAQQEARLRTALHMLPAEQAEVIRKAFFEDKVHVEIERELGIPLGTVKSRLRLAMQRLRDALDDLT